MKLYHGTTEEFWKEIQAEGVLWGRKGQLWMGREMDRITWLAYRREDAGIYDDRGLTKQACVLLEVEVPDEPHTEEAWQYVTYDPIPISKVKRIK
ncbi:MAG: hypothetical protein M0R32_10480 [Candidatus Cloacimonetes bacterium]|jgi:hypothetical protein|nr:hypothetical protein [Candidatus Cloacimonadota bacterium]